MSIQKKIPFHFIFNHNYVLCWPNQFAFNYRLQFLYGSVDVGWAPLRGISQSSASYASMVLPKGRYLSVIFICNQLSPFYIESIQFGTVTPYPGSSISYGPYGICTGTSVSHYVDGVGYMSGTVDSVTNKIMGLVLNKMC